MELTRPYRRHFFRYSRLFGHPEHQFNFFSHQIGGARSKDHEPSFQFRLWTAPGTKIKLLCDRLKLITFFRGFKFPWFLPVLWYFSTAWAK